MSAASSGAEPPALDAAGGVVLRHEGDTVQVLLVHRIKWDDWSLPKGKREPGETAARTALREVEEETGYRCRLGPSLGVVDYRPPEGPKRTAYWLMTPDGGTFAPNDEVDAIRWLPVDEAVRVAHLGTDRRLLRDLRDHLDGFAATGGYP